MPGSPLRPGSPEAPLGPTMPGPPRSPGEPYSKKKYMTGISMIDKRLMSSIMFGIRLAAIDGVPSIPTVFRLLSIVPVFRVGATHRLLWFWIFIVIKII